MLSLRQCEGDVASWHLDRSPRLKRLEVNDGGAGVRGLLGTDPSGVAPVPPQQGCDEQGGSSGAEPFVDAEAPPPPRLPWARTLEYLEMDCLQRYLRGSYRTLCSEVQYLR